MKGTCEFCGMEKDVGNPTPFHGTYCIDCMKMNIQNDREAITAMKQTKTPRTKGKPRRTDFAETERMKDEALNRLMHIGESNLIIDMGGQGHEGHE